jgi:hypothetical protein
MAATAKPVTEPGISAALRVSRDTDYGILGAFMSPWRLGNVGPLGTLAILGTRGHEGPGWPGVTELTAARAARRAWWREMSTAMTRITF